MVGVYHDFNRLRSDSDSLAVLCLTKLRDWNIDSFLYFPQPLLPNFSHRPSCSKRIRASEAAFSRCPTKSRVFKYFFSIFSLWGLQWVSWQLRVAFSKYAKSLLFCHGSAYDRCYQKHAHFLLEFILPLHVVRLSHLTSHGSHWLSCWLWIPNFDFDQKILMICPRLLRVSSLKSPQTLKF